MLKISVKDFGPIEEGSVSFKPLTVFIGSNNVGKSYMAMLAYALGKANQLTPMAISQEILRTTNVPESIRQSIRQLLTHQFPVFMPANTQEKIEIPTEFVAWINDRVQSPLDGRTAVPYEYEMTRCFGDAVEALVRQAPDVKSFQLAYGQDRPAWHLSFRVRNGDLVVKSQDISIWQFSLDNEELVRFSARYRSPEKAGAQEDSDNAALLLVTYKALSELFKEASTQSYYLPAARSGIAHGHRALMASIARSLPLVGIRDIQIPRLMGAVADYLGHLLELDMSKSPNFPDVVRLLEDILQGRVSAEDGGKLGYPETYYYRTLGGRFPLHRTSSMVSELAPIVLYLKYVVEKDSLLIIEEPEAHLHPESQRKLARVMARMIRRGARLLITTHSDYLLNQLSNFIGLGQLSDKERAKRGYSKDDYLNADEVGAYLFKWNESKGGSVIDELTVTSKEGIPEDEFVRVAEDLYNENFYLRHKIHTKKTSKQAVE